MGWSLWAGLGLPLVAPAAGIPWTNGQSFEYQVTGLFQAYAVVADAAHGKLYVAESGRNRVLRFGYPLTNSVAVSGAEAVFGQSDLTVTNANRGASSPAANTLNGANALALSASGDLWIADAGNCRLVKIPNAWSAGTGAAATAVLGQGGFSTAQAVASSTGMSRPSGVALDGSGNLWVADTSNHRVLRFNSVASKGNGAAADCVLGQGDFNSGYANRNSTVSATSLSGPYDITCAGTSVFVADYNNNRVLRYDAAAAKGNGGAADGVLGQTSMNTAVGGSPATATSLFGPCGVAVDASGRLYVSENMSSRVLIYNGAVTKGYGAAADAVLGSYSLNGSGNLNLSAPWHSLYDDQYHRFLLALAGGNTVNQYFNCYGTATALTSTPNPCLQVGGTVTFTATVTTTTPGGPLASSNVMFMENNTVLGTVALNAAGQAVWSTPSLADGTHSIVAVYGGSTTHHSSQSDAYSQTMGKYTPTYSLASSANPAGYQVPIRFTVTVGASSGLPTPTGTVVFQADGGSGTAVTLSGGIAIWTNSSLAQGSHAIAATYSGDANFRTATATLTETVYPPGYFSFCPIANSERDSDGTTSDYYSGVDQGGYLYFGTFEPSAGLAAFKFDLSQLSGVGGTISSAKLRVRCADKYVVDLASNPQALVFGSEDDSWSDLAPVSVPASTVSPALAQFPMATPNVNDWVTNDVTAFVRAQAAGDQIATVVFKTDATTGNDYLCLYSREADPTNQPMLEVLVALDVTPPSVSGITGPAAGAYRAGQTLDFSVQFSEPVLVKTSSGVPSLGLTIGGQPVSASYVSGSNSSTLVFRYTVSAGDNGALAAASPLKLNGGTMQDAAGNNATLTFSGANFATVLADTTAPLLVIGAPSSSLVNTSAVQYAISLTEANPRPNAPAAGAVTVNKTGTANANVVMSGAASPWTVTLTNISGDGTLGISLNAGAVTDAAGNASAAVGPSATFTVDNTAPQITSALTAAGTFNAAFSYTIAASGSPVSYFVTNLPTGLNLDTGTGKITGTPSVAGTYSVGLGARDAAGNAGVSVLTLTLAKALATVSLNSLSQTYSGAACAVAVSTVPTGLAVTFTYNGLNFAPTNAGTYTVVATINDSRYSGSSTNTLSINPVLSLTGTPGFYVVGQPAVKVDSAATLGDGGALVYSNATLTVAISANATSGDQLSLPSQGSGAGLIQVSGSTVTRDGLTLATISGGNGGAPLALSLTTNDTSTNVMALLRLITFGTSNTNSNSRGLTVTLSYGTNSMVASRSLTLDRCPVTQPASFVATSNQVLTILFSSVLANDSDVDGDALTVSSCSPSASGASVSLTANALVYTPSATRGASDRFSYVADDGRGGQTSGQVSLTFVPANRLNITVPGLNTNGATLSFAGVPGAKYAIEVSTNLVNWSAISTNTASGTGLIQFMDSQAKDLPKRFYRTATR